VLVGAFDPDVAALAAVAAARAATGHILLSSEREAAIAAVAGLNGDDRLVYKHGGCSGAPLDQPAA